MQQRLKEINIVTGQKYVNTVKWQLQESTASITNTSKQQKIKITLCMHAYKYNKKVSSIPVCLSLLGALYSVKGILFVDITCICDISATKQVVRIS
jgi:hypothetical protein